MSKSFERRRLLNYCLTGLGAALLPLPAVRLQAASADGLQPLRAGVSLLVADGSNILVCDTAEGLVLVDSGSAAYSEGLLQTLEQLNTAGVHTLFNTHWHADQCGGNEALGLRGATIIAHRKTWQHLATEIYLPTEQRYRQPLPDVALPKVLVHDKGSLQVGGQRIDYGALVQPHTDADIYVHFRDANVLAAGGAVASELDPELDWYGGGWLGGRVNSLDTLVALANDDTLIVPASGRVISKAELVVERDMTQTLYNRALDLIRAGCSADCMLQEGALEGLGRQWQDPQRFLYAVYKGMWAHHYNLAPNIL
jgi:cyclase